MASRFLGTLELKELAVRTWRESNEDNIFGAAAQLGYYFLLALFPMLIFLTSIIGFAPGLQNKIIDVLGNFAPGDAMRLVQDTLHDVTANRNHSLLSFGLLGTLWAASNGVVAVIQTLNVAYDAKEQRSFWKIRVVAIGLTVGLSVLIAIGTVLILFGDKLAGRLSDVLGVSAPLTFAWHVLDYLLGLAVLFVAIELVYYFGPNVKQSWRWITPGAVFAVGAIVLGSLALSLYLRFAPSYSATYGSLGAVIVLMLWLYVVGLVVLVGAEMNAEIENAAGKPRIQREAPGSLQAA